MTKRTNEGHGVSSPSSIKLATNFYAGTAIDLIGVGTCVHTLAGHVQAVCMHVSM